MGPRPLLFAFASLAVVGLTGCAGTPDESEEVAEAQQAQVVCAAGETIEGIDVSVWQGDVDWSAVKGDGISFAFARASYGASKDTYFDQNWAGMKAAGLVRGAYQYWLPADDPIEQAEAMVQILGQLDASDLPPVVDVEESDGLGPAQIAERLAQWIGHVEKATGRKPIIYSGKYFWKDSVQSDAFLDYPLWIPNYSLDCPDLADGYWPDWRFFQYTSTGSVDGVSGNVDRDTFNGSLQDLYAFASTGAAKYAAEFVSQSFPYTADGPLYMLTGQPVTVTLELKNTGTAPWDESTRLGTTEPRDRESPFAGPEWLGPNRYAQVEGVVMPGETYTFKWTMHAPKAPGLYDEHIGVVQEGVAWFSDPGQGGPPDPQLEGLFQVIDPTPLDEDGNPVGTRPPRPEVRPNPDDGDPDGTAKAAGSCAVEHGRSTGQGRTAGSALFAALAFLALARKRRKS